MSDPEDSQNDRDRDEPEYDEDWDAWAESVLADSDYDTDLGKRMARDARRVATDDLAPERFFERFHEEVEAAFGVDNREVRRGASTDTEAPDAESAGGPTDSADPQPGVPRIDDQPSRRTLLGAIGGIIGAGTLASAASNRVRGYTRSGGAPEAGADQVAGGDGAEGKQLGMVIDTERCVACLKCSLACKQENDTDHGMHWVYVFRYREERFDQTDEEWLTRPCQHCTDPSCVYVCPTQARHKRWYDDGLVLTDYDRCVGCKYCMVACPYGVNFLGEAEPTDLSPGFQYDTHGKNDRWVAGPPPEGVMGKCTFCVHRQDSGDPDLEGTTACEDICPVDAIHFGDLTDPSSDPRSHLRTKPRSHTFHLLDEVGNEPNVIYIGKEPSKDAEPIPGPTRYEDRGMAVFGDFGYDEGGDGH